MRKIDFVNVISWRKFRRFIFSLGTNNGLTGDEAITLSLLNNFATFRYIKRRRNVGETACFESKEFREELD